MMSALFRSEFYTRMKRYWGENISIYRMRKLLFTILKVKLFLKQGISRQLGRMIIHFLWKIFHKPIVPVVLTTANFFWGGSVISTGTIHDLRRVKVPGTGPLWNPWVWNAEHNFGRGPPKDHFSKVWLRLAEQFQRRRFFFNFIPPFFYF